MQTIGCVSGQMCTKTMVSGQFAFISWIYLQQNDMSSYVTEDLYIVNYLWVHEPRDSERTNGQLVTMGVEPMDTCTVHAE